MWHIKKIIKKGEYLYAKVSGHPNATRHGYVLAHRIVVENSIGRILGPLEVVHHRNGNKKDNRPDNLEIMTRDLHGRHHMSHIQQRMVTMTCVICGKEFVRPRRNTHLVKGGRFTSCSRSCGGKMATLPKEDKAAMSQNYSEVV